MNPKTKWRYADVCRGIVADFDALPIDETLRKPRVGIVGEILVSVVGACVCIWIGRKLFK